LKGGENIFPGDIEKVLDLHPEITASAVVGVPDTYWGEAVVAFIQPAAAGTSTPTKDMKLWLRNKLAPHKVPEHFFWLSTGGGVPDALPVNATGKVVKKELREVAINLAETRKN
jgi:acyl-CoA synthetase (AMP-forming)/AMP-acid ligase II